MQFLKKAKVHFSRNIELKNHQKWKESFENCVKFRKYLTAKILKSKAEKNASERIVIKTKILVLFAE